MGRIVGNEEYINEIKEEIYIYKNLNIKLVNIPKINFSFNTKNNYQEALKGFYWKSSTDNFDDNIKAINDGKCGFFAPTGPDKGFIVLDWDDKGDACEESRKILDICLKYNTFTVKTPRGDNGYHFYFKYTDAIPRNKTIWDNIDFRSSGGIVFAASNREDGKYRVVDKTKSILEIPNEIIESIILYEDTKIKKQITPYKDIKKNIDDAKKECKLIKNFHNPDTIQKYNISTLDVKRLILTLPEVYSVQYKEWFLVTIICKKYGYYEIWDEFSRKSIDSYNKQRNNEIWDWVNIQEMDIDLNALIIYHNKHYKSIKDKRYLKNLELIHHKYKPISDENLKKFKVINTRYLPIEIFSGVRNMLVKIILSPMGSGKSYGAQKYTIINNHKVLCICHLKSLISNMVFNFNKNAEKFTTKYDEYRPFMISYEDKDDIIKGSNVCSSIDSLISIIEKIWDIDEYIIYIDEVHSVIDYLIKCPTIEKNRREIIRVFVDILKRCKGVITTDGDVNDNTISFFESHKFEIECIKNEYKSFNKKPAKIYRNKKHMLKMMREMIIENKYFTVCANTKTRIKKIKKLFIELGVDIENRLLIYTAEEGDKNLLDVNKIWNDKWVIFSPTIIQGVDRTSTTPETVFCFIEGFFTLTIDQAIQQITRNRNIECVNICANGFMNILQYKSLEDCENYHFMKTDNYIKNISDSVKPYASPIYDDNGFITEYKKSTYTDMFIRYEYNKSLLIANPCYTLKRLLENIGFEVNDSIFNDIDNPDFIEDVKDDIDDDKKEIFIEFIKYLKKEDLKPNRSKLADIMINNRKYIQLKDEALLSRFDNNILSLDISGLTSGLEVAGVEDLTLEFEKDCNNLLYNVLVNHNNILQYFLNICYGFIYSDNALLNKSINDTTTGYVVFNSDKIYNLVRVYRKIMNTYLSEINIFSYEYDPTDKDFLNSPINMTEDDYMSISYIIRSKKKIPETKGEVIKLVNMILKRIIGPLYCSKEYRYIDEDEHGKKTKKKYTYGYINKKFFKAMMIICNMSIDNKTTIKLIHKDIKELYNINGICKISEKYEKEALEWDKQCRLYPKYDFNEDVFLSDSDDEDNMDLKPIILNKDIDDKYINMDPDLNIKDESAYWSDEKIKEYENEKYNIKDVLMSDEKRREYIDKIRLDNENKYCKERTDARNKMKSEYATERAEWERIGRIINKK